MLRDDSLPCSKEPVTSPYVGQNFRLAVS